MIVKKVFGFMMFLLMVSTYFAAYTPPVCDANNQQGCFQKTLQDLACLVRNALAVGMLLLVVLAAIVYAVGQVMGAETRARASVWATAMFTGAIIGALLYILLPFILSKLLSDGGASEVPDWTILCPAAAPPA